MKTILHKIRFFFGKKKEPFLLFYDILAFYPINIEYYELAVRHKSLPIQTKDGQELSNERLEFLGDAILNSVVTDIIYHRFEDKQEGFLTKLRSKMVSREFLNQMAIKIGLNKLVVASRYVNQHANHDIYGNALEALFGAIYLDYGYKKCKFFVEHTLSRYFLDWDEIIDNEINFKSKVFEWCHKNQLEPEFILLEEIIVKNKHTFRTSLKIQGETISEAVGGSKKASQQKASKIAYEQICNNPIFLKTIKENDSARNESKVDIESENIE